MDMEVARFSGENHHGAPSEISESLVCELTRRNPFYYIMQPHESKVRVAR